MSEKRFDFFKELERMCEMEKDGRGNCSDNCPYNNGGLDCPNDRDITHEDINIVRKWSDEHPAPKPKTYADDFFEKFPTASRADGKPDFCRARLYKTICRTIKGDYNHFYDADCFACWNEVMPE